MNWKLNLKIDQKRLSERYEKELAGKNLTPDMENDIGEYFSEEHSRIEGLYSSASTSILDFNK